MNNATAYFYQDDTDNQIDVHLMIPSMFKDKTTKGHLVNIAGVPCIGSFPTVSDALTATKDYGKSNNLNIDISNITDVLYDEE